MRLVPLLFAALAACLHPAIAASEVVDDLSHLVETCDTSRPLKPGKLSRCLTTRSERLRFKCQFRESPAPNEVCTSSGDDETVIFLWQQKRHPSRYYAVINGAQARCFDANGNDVIRQHFTTDTYGRVKSARPADRRQWRTVLDSDLSSVGDPPLAGFHLLLGRARKRIAAASFQAIIRDESDTWIPLEPVLGSCVERP